MNEGRHVRREHGVREGGSVRGRELRRRQGGRELRAGQAGEAGGGGRRGGGREGGREGDTNDQCQAWLCTEGCQLLLAFTLY